MTTAFLRCLIIKFLNLQDKLHHPSQKTRQSMCAQDGTGVMAPIRKQHVFLEKMS